MRLLTLCLLYLAQGLPWGFVTVTLAAWLATQGVPATGIAAVVGASQLPWAAKWIAGPALDAWALPFRGRRTGWILLAQAGMAGTLLPVATLADPVAQLQLLTFLVFLHNSFAALQDVAVDAFAVDALTEDERGRANGLMYGSKYFGGWLGGALLSSQISALGLRGAVLVQIVAIVIIGGIALRLREAPAPPPQEAGFRRVVAVLRQLIVAFRPKVVWAFVFALWIRQAGAGLLSSVAPSFFITRLAWTQEDYGALMGGTALVAGLVGSIAGGWTADRLGARTQLVAVTCLQLGGWLGFALLEPHWTQPAWLTLFVCVDSLFDGLAAVAIFSLAMSLSDRKVGATQFTAFMSVFNLGTASGAALAWVPGLLGWPTTYVVAAAITALALPPLLLFRRPPSVGPA